MPRESKPPAKAACLACRSSKTRCDGQQPCRSCSFRERECSYRPSRRGGPRRGIRYAETKQASSASDGHPAPCSPSGINENIEPYFEDMLGLIAPLAGVHNLDLSPDVLSDSTGAHQLWSQGHLTPSDGPSSSTPAANADLPFIRSYRSEEDIVNAYYIYIHPFFPLLPPCIAPQKADQPDLIRPPAEYAEASMADLPYWPESSLSLAFSALLVLIPHPQDESPLDKSRLLCRRTYAQLFAQAALSDAQKKADDLGPTLGSTITGVRSSQEASPLHPQAPLQLEPILSLLLLAIYEYCQRGNVSRMRARVNQAITTCMDISLHGLGTDTTKYSEAQRRAWWMAMLVIQQSANLQHTPPIILSHDPRITTPYPNFGVILEPWEFLTSAQNACYASHSKVRQIESGQRELPALELREELKELDDAIVVEMANSDRMRQSALLLHNQGEELAAENMWRIGQIWIHTARIRLHRLRAFMDIPLFVDAYCDLASINSHGISFPPTPSDADTWTAQREFAFPFTEQESSTICLKSALAVASAYRNLRCSVLSTSGPNEGSISSGRFIFPSTSNLGRIPRTVPYFACSAMQSSYCLLMLLHRVRACLADDRLEQCHHLLNKPEPATEIADAERLIEELRHGVECLGVSLKSDAIFEGVGGMGYEAESAYLAAFPECTEI